ncbi:DUF6049 family protein [Antrihabitans sp. YC2-6]|uniref:DUF6049 family protein n=1 Tax=Antrihabitans sp. YC2-6 TaxID=2799498 RepID=UPI0018F58A36|nr:DUF6049 family protein [Antrihabitans sp. YC2-6]MBJ8346458.1 glycoprotein [Antrihabitans sp. YC2-6]
MTLRWTRTACAALAVVALGLGPAGTLAVATPFIEAPSSDAPEFLDLTIDAVTPSSVTTTSDPTVTVTATVTNVGDRPVTDVSVRMQRAPAVATAAELRTSLTLDQHNFDVVGEFVTVSERLPAGEHQRFSLEMPMRAAVAAPDKPDLEITAPGVYPMLLNVNGAPEFGDDARLDDARFLLPVLGLPADPTAPDPASPEARPIPPSTANPVATTLLWPLADRPRLVAGRPGSLDESVILVDDDLATSLAKGGRLDSLVSALEFAVEPDVDREKELADSTCIAIDPDLLVTVSNMTRGYLVRDDANDANSDTHEGTGATAAAEWLERVRGLASEMCTIALPFAQVDLPAVRAVDNKDLSTSAVVAPSDVVDNLLSTTSMRGVTWPDSGSIDDDTGAFLHDLGTDTLLLARNAVDAAEPVPDLVRINSTAPTEPKPGDQGDELLHAATFDVQAATALAAVGPAPQTPSFTPSKSRYELLDDSPTARLQDALGAITWPAISPPNDRPRSMLLAPPQEFGANRDEAGAILSEVSTLLRSGLAVPRKLADLIARPPDPQPVDLVYTQQAVDDAIPDDLRDAARTQAPRVGALLSSLVEDPQTPLTPRLFGAPLREDLLRAMSLAGRRDDTKSAAEEAARERISESVSAVDAMFDAVTIISPGGGYTLASEQSPLVLVARNDLPIGINVRLRIDAPPVMKITDIGEQQLPARGSRALRVPAEVSDTRNLFVDVALTTPSGHELGEPTTVSVRSNAYGQALAIITGCAGGLLLLLAGRRLLHRFRGQPDPADEGHERI